MAITHEFKLALRAERHDSARWFPGRSSWESDTSAGAETERGYWRMFHYLARAWITSGSSVLVAHEIGADNTFLPGGHIEHGEPARDALQREILEETGVLVEVGDFLGACEAAWEQDGRLHCEINLVFACHLPGLDASSAVESLEKHLDFHWIPKEDVDAVNLLPESMRRLAHHGPFDGAFWGSTLE